MELSEKERLMLSNQYRILSLLTNDEEESQNYENLSTIYLEGYTRDYDYNDEIQEELSPEECKFVVDVISMYDKLQTSWNNLDEHEKSSLDIEEVKFNGFDLNDPVEVRYYGYAKFLIDDMGKWSRFKEEALKENSFNSHGFGPDPSRLAKMLEVFKQTNDPGNVLNLEQIQSILNTR